MLPLGRKPGTEDEQLEAASEGQDAWAAIDKTVRNIDESKVKDCTDDIDTLLVFAGLYSAVLTAFLIESYKNLLEDPQNTMVELLRQIVTQNYTVNGRSINSTATSSALPSFRVATSDIRINVCWFASLVLSLSTASYGILVKQWLREYLSIDRISPQERIRIRHFRARGLEVWKLFDIAAILPVILQFSLTLFFVGLCFFTASVHPSIGWTSIGLVSGWAFFFTFAVLAPLISSRCPYKTTFLKSAFRRLRSRIHRIVESPLVFIGSFQQDSERHESPIREGSTSLGNAEGHSPVEDSVNLACLKHFAEYLQKEDTSIQEELKIRSSDANDLIIFRTVDSIFLDDKLLALMREALKRRPPPGHKVLEFAVTITQHRLSIPIHEITINSVERVQWPWALSHTTRTSLINIVSDSLLFELCETSVTQWYDSSPGANLQWTKDAIQLIFLLLSPHDMLPRAAISVFEHLLKEASGLCFTGQLLLGEFIRNGSGDVGDWSTRILTGIAGALKICTAEDAAFALQGIIHVGFVNSDQSITIHTNTYDQLLAQTRPDNRSNCTVVPLETITVLVDIAAMILYNFTAEDHARDSQHPTAFPQTIESLLDFVLKAMPVIVGLPGVNLKRPHIAGGVGLDRTLVGLFTAPRLIHPFLEFFSGRSNTLSAGVVRQFLFDALDSNQRFLTGETGINLLSTCADYFDAKMNSEIPLELISALRVCHLVYACPIDDRNILSDWHRMFRNVVGCAKRVWPHPEEASCQDVNGRHEHADTCMAAYELLGELDSDFNEYQDIYRSGQSTKLDTPEEEAMYAWWLEHFNADTSQVPDVMVELLVSFVCSKNTDEGNLSKFWRIRRLEDITTKPKFAANEKQSSTAGSGRGLLSATLKPMSGPLRLHADGAEDVPGDRPTDTVPISERPTSVTYDLAKMVSMTSEMQGLAAMWSPLSPAKALDDINSKSPSDSDAAAPMPILPPHRSPVPVDVPSDHSVNAESRPLISLASEPTTESFTQLHADNPDDIMYEEHTANSEAEPKQLASVPHGLTTTAMLPQLPAGNVDTYD